MERLSGHRNANEGSAWGLPGPRTVLRAALGEQVGDIGKYLTRRYVTDQLDSVQIAQEIGEVYGVELTGMTVRNWLRAIGWDCRDPHQRDSASYLWTQEAADTRNEVMRTPRMKRLQSRKMKKYWRRRKYLEHVEEYGAPFATIKASK